jgi:hypothetical protein
MRRNTMTATDNYTDTATATAYVDQCVSDLHKDAYGFRPSRRFLNKWEEMTPAQKQTEWEYLCRESDNRADEERRLNERRLVEFEGWLTKTCDAIGHDVDFLRSEEHVRKALRWMTQEERDNGWMKNSQDAEHWVWERGFLFTERGREVVEMLKRIYKMEY